MFDTTKTPFAPFFAAWDGQLARVEAYWTQVAELETKALAQAKSSVDEQARLAHEALAFAGNLSTELRKSSIEMAKRTAEMMTTPLA